MGLRKLRYFKAEFVDQVDHVEADVVMQRLSSVFCCRAQRDNGKTLITGTFRLVLGKPCSNYPTGLEIKDDQILQTLKSSTCLSPITGI